MNLEEYVSKDATELASLVAGGEVTAPQLLELARRRAYDVDGKLNSIVARTDSAADDAAQTLGRGPFAGVPFLLKDLAQEYKGYPTSYGSRSLADDIATENSLITQRFLDAGLVVFGKTNTPELGAKGVTESDYWGPARNPWNLHRTPGGSSGGSGAAVAAGIVPAAGANDGGGSIRIPAACNGLVGLKLSRGLSPYGPQTGEIMFGMVSQGVVSRTVRDSAALYDAIVGPDPSAGYLAQFPTERFVDAIRIRPTGLRIGWSTSSTVNPSPHPEAVAAVEHAAALLEELGHHVEEVPQPYDDWALSRDFLTIWFAQVYAQVAEIKARTGAKNSDFEADTLAVAEYGRHTGFVAPVAALENTKVYTQSLAAFHRKFDFLLTPTLATPPLRIGAASTPPMMQRAARAAGVLRAGRIMDLTGILDDVVQNNLGWVPYTQLANVTGRPAISVPVHWTSDGLPLGVQFVGHLGSDGALLRLAAQIEEAAPWIHRFPATATPV
ncbi:amidase [Rhodococcus sp. 15-649-1-2]|nr:MULTISPECIES: amidase [unclassified Rhodococcus (in: high G+C Gram-positive bacteria)]OZE76541.1 amidase [Rhodococcus sp. 15-649-1-2]OZE98593.1 amidase [Rhodococcus sp. 15-1154-1]